MDELIIQKLPEQTVLNESRRLYRKVRFHLAEGFPGGDLRLGKESHANWGRPHKPTWSALISSVGIITISPFLVIFTWITLSQHQGSLLNAIGAMYSDGLQHHLAQYGPTLSLQTCAGYAIWVSTQAALYNYLPARLSTGQLTPAGHLLQYYTNGLSAWVFTHIAFILGIYFQMIDPACIAKNWSGLLVAANAYGFLVSAFVYIKAYVAPTHAKDRKFSGNQ
jgi:7-dehydrocholesterol reductase